MFFILLFRTLTNDVLCTINNIQLEYGSVVTSYEYYKEVVRNITLPSGNKLNKLTNGVYDYLDVDGNMHKLTKTITGQSATQSINYSDMKNGGYYIATNDYGEIKVGIKGETLAFLNGNVVVIYELKNEIITMNGDDGLLVTGNIEAFNRGFILSESNDLVPISILNYSMNIKDQVVTNSNMISDLFRETGEHYINYSNPHQVSYSQVGALANTNFYYDNTTNNSVVYVKFASIVNSGTYNKFELIFNASIVGNSRDTGKIEIAYHGSSAYNTTLSSTHFTMNSKVNYFSDDSFMYVITDNGSDTYIIDLWAKVINYAGFYVTTLHQFIEDVGSDSISVSVFNDSPITSSSEPSGVVYFDNRKEKIVSIDSDYFIALGGESSFTIPVDYNSSNDKFNLYVNGLKMIENRHFTISGSVVTFLNSYTLSVNDEVEIVVDYNVIV